MKKLFSLVLCFVIVFCFASCKKDDNKNTVNVDLEYYAKLGKIPEAEFTLGDNVDDVIDKLTDKQNQFQSEHGEDPDHSHDHNKADFFFDVVEGDKNVLIDNGVVNYYYNKNNEKNGIAYIVNYDTAFNLEVGTLISEAEEHFKGFEFSQEPATEENVFFAPYITDGTVLKTEIGDVVIMLVFQENQLFATAMYDSNNWKP